MRFRAMEGDKTVYLSVSFIDIDGMVDGKPVRVERPLEFFMPAGQREEGQQWIASTMRLLSMVARSGGSVAKALADLREVVWDRGPVRCGKIVKEDGSIAPRFHDSEVAALAFWLQEVLKRRGILDAAGNQIPVGVLARRQPQDVADMDDDPAPPTPTMASTGKICPECHGPYLRKVDGCEKCDNCGHIGTCG